MSTRTIALVAAALPFALLGLLLASFIARPYTGTTTTVAPTPTHVTRLAPVRVIADVPPHNRPASPRTVSGDLTWVAPRHARGSGDSALRMPYYSFEDGAQSTTRF